VVVAVVLIVVAVTVLKMTSNVMACVASESIRTVGVTLAVAGFVHGTVWNDVITGATVVSATDRCTCFSGE